MSALMLVGAAVGAIIVACGLVIFDAWLHPPHMQEVSDS